jgi:hypothetical protein
MRSAMGEAPGTREILSSHGIESSRPTGATRSSSSSLSVARTSPKISSSPVLLRHPRSHQNLQGEHTNLPEPWKLTVSKRFLGASSGKLILPASQARVQPQQQASGKRIQPASKAPISTQRILASSRPQRSDASAMYVSSSNPPRWSLELLLLLRPAQYQQ